MSASLGKRSLKSMFMSWSASKSFMASRSFLRPTTAATLMLRLLMPSSNSCGLILPLPLRSRKRKAAFAEPVFWIRCILKTSRRSSSVISLGLFDSASSSSGDMASFSGSLALAMATCFSFAAASTAASAGGASFSSGGSFGAASSSGASSLCADLERRFFARERFSRRAADCSPSASSTSEASSSLAVLPWPPKPCCVEARVTMSAFFLRVRLGPPTS
mmetsp:Transcript_106251/g.228937  ORF Transcript_106251/g.228937 Transcript_106251/m.228937 type:complete len:219 (+) Transcript_106251:1017-1673(+)